MRGTKLLEKEGGLYMRRWRYWEPGSWATLETQSRKKLETMMKVLQVILNRPNDALTQNNNTRYKIDVRSVWELDRVAKEVLIDWC